MTVKQALEVLKNATKVNLGCGANSIPFDKDDPVIVAAFGDFAVDQIACCDSDANEYEIGIRMVPVKEG